MVVELPFVLALAVHLRHVLERIEHALHDLVVRRIDALPDLERVRADELRLDAADVGREVLDERRDPVALLARQLVVLDSLDVIVLLATSNAAHAHADSNSNLPRRDQRGS